MAARKRAWRLAPAAIELRARELNRAIPVVEARDQSRSARIAAPPNVREMRAASARHSGIRGRVARQQGGRSLCDSKSAGCASQHNLVERIFDDAPRRPPALSRGMMSRTVRSSRIVFTASHSSSLSGEMVGRWSAGSSVSTSWSRSRSTFSISPTLPSALMAPSSSSAMIFDLRRFQASSQDAHVGDQLGVGFHHGVDDREADWRAGESRFR